MEECGFTVTRNPSEMAKLLKGLLYHTSASVLDGAWHQIILANIVLSGDNAVVIALAARSLPPTSRTKAIFWGSAAAIVMRIILTLIAVEMLKWPYLKIIGALLLLYIGISLLGEDSEDEDGQSRTTAR